MNTDLKDVMQNLNDLVADPSTLTSFNRLGDTFNLTQDAGQKIVPAQTVCDYWNYWMTYLTSHFELPTPFGYAERVIPPSIAGSTSPGTPPRNPMDNYSGGQGDGRFSTTWRRSNAGEFEPLQRPGQRRRCSPATRTTAIPILHGNPYGPAGTNGQPNCQAGPDRLRPGRGPAPGPGPETTRPSASLRTLPRRASGMPALGKTDLFLQQNGDRVFWDQANNRPESGK